MDKCLQCSDGTSCNKTIDGQFFDSKTIKPCMDKCLQCSNGTSCDKVQEGYYFDPESYYYFE